MKISTYTLFGLLISICAHSSALANPRADALLDTIDVFLSPTNMKAVGLDASYAELVTRDVQRKRYRRVRALSALTLLAPAQARALLPKLMVEDPDREVRAQSVIHLARVFGASHSQQVREALMAARSAHAQDEGFCTLVDAELKRAQLVNGPHNGGL